MNKSFNILAFEAATQTSSVALSVDNQEFCRIEKTPKRSSEVLLPLINELLLSANLSISDLNAIAVGIGPGSFMGVRLAVGVAQGLAFPHQIPIIGISTLQILAQTAFEELKAPSVLAAWDARMQEMYYGVYQLDSNGIMQQQQPDQLIAPPQYVLSKNMEKHTLTGNAWSVYYDDFSSTFKNNFDLKTAEHAFIYPHAKHLLPIARHRYQQKTYTSASELSPVYLRNKIT